MTTAISFAATQSNNATSRTRSPARHAVTAARILLGFVFFVCGLDGFLHFIPQPTEPVPPGAMNFAIALMQTGYMFQLIKGTELVAGAVLLANRGVPLALVLLAPVIVNIVAFHLVLTGSGLAIPLVIVGLELFLAWSYRHVFGPVLALRSSPRL